MKMCWCAAQVPLISPARKRSWATHINDIIIAFALQAPSAAVLRGNAGAPAGIAATAQFWQS